MRNALEEIEQIERYLLNQMSGTEKATFEQAIQSDPVLSEKIKQQQLLMDGMKRIDIKESIQSSANKYFFRKKLLKGGLGGAAVIAAAFIILLVNGTNPVADLFEKKIVEKPYVNPPFPEANVPYMEYMIPVNTETVITCPSGSMIHIPEQAFVDSNGAPIPHEIKLRYREFHDPAEIFLAGIPMQYDSAGIHYDFESAGMFELLAFDGDRPVYIAPEKPITVELASLSPENKFNQYYLDTLNRRWNYISTDPPIQFTGNNSELSTSPVIPVASDPSKFRISIEADPAEFPELAVYKGIKFEVSDETKDFNPKWATKVWDNATLERYDRSKYMIVFEKRSEKHEVIVYPVLDSKDREKAIKEFQLKTLRSDSLLQYRKIQEMTIASDSQRRLEALDSARIAKDVIAAQAEATSQRMAEERENVEGTVFRMFKVNNFGIYNSDCPMGRPQGPRVWAKFMDDNTKKYIQFNCFYLVDKDRNTMYTNYANTYFPEFTFNPARSNMIWAITSQNQLAICSQEEFAQAKKQDDNYQTFKMHITEEKPKNVKEAKRLLGF